MSLIYLLRHGIPYDAVMEMDERTINVVIGILAALDERSKQD